MAAMWTLTVAWDCRWHSVRAESAAAVGDEDTIRSLLAADPATEKLAPLAVDYPLAEAIFPPGFPPPTFVWHDPTLAANRWLIDVTLADGAGRIDALTSGDLPAPAPETPPEQRPEPARS
jgi:hypothetical protein